MSELRCRHCGIRHDERLVICPATGLAIGPGSSLPPRQAMHTPRSFIPPAPSIPRPMGIPAARVPAPAPVANARPAPPGAAPNQQNGPSSQSSHRLARRDLVGHVIGDKYRVKALLGEGGMGAVYEAEHLAIGRIVAVKVLHPKHAQQADSVARLKHEARIAGSIGHPNICEIYDLGRLEDGTPYLVMERLVGETLDQRIKRDGALPERDVADVMHQVLSALTAAHAKAIIHRDLKPENVFLVRKAGVPPIAKLLDFGISKAIDEDTSTDLTMPGIVMGTPYYMAPEQARGDRGLDHRVDLWAAGVILYEALTGRRPFVARNYNALLVQILTSKHRSLSEVRPNVTRGLERVVDKALAKMREDRYQNALEFQDGLRRALEPEAPPPSRRAPLPPAKMSFSEDDDDETMVLSFSRKDLGLPIAPPRSSKQGTGNAGPPPSSRAAPPTTVTAPHQATAAPHAAAPHAAAPSLPAPLPPPLPPPAPLPPPPHAAQQQAPQAAASSGGPPPTMPAGQLASMGVGSGRQAWLPPPPAPLPPPSAPPHPAPVPIPVHAAAPLPPPPPRPIPPARPVTDDDDDERTLVDPPSFNDDRPSVSDDRPTLVRPFPARPVPGKGS
ncbi:serine/threonine-protein kinase [Polyangium sp. y55x31]|uniref:serine/threonine-protein kinase n=1 Tax=Polyangium sp. y55x31 TaxID=3042688 RepID=UPI002482C0E2|nr:serine/threonine-protein kinase [Polyangium sp. y55x31]MDI1480573.1 serine/threonine-protein kinase [Polyangium sp. y55x31]